MPMRPELERGPGSGQFHGGPIAAFVDVVGDHVLVMLLGGGVPTINFRVDFLRPAVSAALLGTGRLRRCLRRGGRLLTCGATAGFDPRTDIRYIWTFELQVLGSNGWTPQDRVTLLEMVEERRLSPVIDRVLPLREAPEGLRLLAEREVIAKVIVVP